MIKYPRYVQVNTIFTVCDGGHGLKKIGVLTYQVRHRKTFDTLSLLKARGYDDVAVFAMPFTYKKKVFPIYQHRPEMNYDIPDIEELSRNFGYTCHMGTLEEFDIEPDRIMLVAGAGILPDEFIKTHTVINAHPGYIPDCRGLDSLKWAIAEDKPVGVSTHIIGDYVDAGEVIERRLIPIYTTDTFHALAERVYENEVSMLVEAIEKTDASCHETIIPDTAEVHRRMGEDIEKTLMEKFEQYRIKHGTEREN